MAVEMIIECSECGHEHFDSPNRRYLLCPIEACPCPFAGGDE